MSGDIFSVESDTGDKMVRFPREANGNVSPKSILHTPHRVYNIAADEVKQELFVTVEFPPEVVVYPKGREGEDQPARRIAGDNTGLDAPHGIAVDEKTGCCSSIPGATTATSESRERASTFRRPSRCTRSTPTGDAKPLRVDHRRQDPAGLAGSHEVQPGQWRSVCRERHRHDRFLFLPTRPTANGDVAPVRVIKGPSTRLRNPTGIAIDRKNQEVWVSNLGNSTATVYPLMANGDVAPLPESFAAQKKASAV